MRTDSMIGAINGASHEVLERHVANCRRADHAYGDGVARALKLNFLRSRAAAVQEILEVVQRDIRLGGHGFDSLKTNVR
jgi:hypothetical protein